MRDFFLGSTHLGNSLENHSRVIVVGIRVDEVHRTPCRVLHSFDLHHPERKEEWWEGQKGQQDTHVNGFELSCLPPRANLLWFSWAPTCGR